MFRRRYRQRLFRLISILFCLILFICLLLLVNVVISSVFFVPNESISTELKFIRKTNISKEPKEAFVTFTNNEKRYLKLLKVLLDSIHTFSTRPIIVYGIDVNINIDMNQYPQVITRLISQQDCGSSAYFCKIHAIISSNLDYGVLLETDDIVNYNIDVLFDILHLWPYSVPLSPRHPHDPGNYKIFMKNHIVTKRTMPYTHAHIIWNFRALSFLRQVQSLLKQGYFEGADYDETALNVMLWKAKANHTLCTYDPYYASLKSYERWPLITNCSKNCHNVFLTLHGSKNAINSANILSSLKSNIGKPPVQTFGMGGMKHINDTSATCCHSDSKPSAIHPLICEHKTLD